MTPLRAILWLARVGLAATFIYAGAIKAWNPAAFAQEIDGYCLVPRWLAAAGALYLPWLEIACGLALLHNRLHKSASLLLSLLLLIFIAVLVSAALRGLDVSCGCFGPATGHTTYTKTIARDAGLFALALASAWPTPRRAAAPLA